MTSVNIDELHDANSRPANNLVVLTLGLTAASLTYVPFLFGSNSSSHLLVMGVFVVAFVGMLWLPYLQCFSLLPRVLVILFALRPLLDAAQSKEAQRSALSLQNLFALVVALLLILLWRKNTFSGFLARLPNNILLV